MFQVLGTTVKGIHSTNILERYLDLAKLLNIKKEKQRKILA